MPAMSRFKRIGASAGWIAVFATASFAILKLIFGMVCWIAGHDPLETAVGAIAPVVFGILIGVEAYLWFKDWRARV
nr:hypothetical protein RKHAN_04128 [Rhizobium sp. Khangiran2]